jgi:hypothetical protein
MNGAAEDMPSQQHQAQEGNAGVPRRQGPGAASIAHAQNHEPQAKHRRQTKQNDCGKDHAFSRIKECDARLSATGFNTTERSKRGFELCAPPRRAAKADDQSNGASRHLSEITLDQSAREDCLIAA